MKRNFSGNCAGPMVGTIHVDSPNAVTLKVKQEDCHVFADCNCPYDMSLGVQGIALDEDVNVTIEHLRCGGSSYSCEERALLPLKESDTASSVPTLKNTMSPATWRLTARVPSRRPEMTTTHAVRV